jgi:hypothetical protein
MNRISRFFIPGALIIIFSSALFAQEELEGVFEQVKTGVENRAVNLEEAVNSPAADFGPIISADGNRLFFTSDRPGGLGGQDFWVSERIRGQWTEARNIGAPVNTAEDEGPDSFSIFEDALYFTACNRADGYGACDLYMTRETRTGWSRPTNLGPKINSKYNEANASVSSNGEILIFASDRPGGSGDYDLWMARRKTSGLGRKRFCKPENLGPGVNTPEWEGVGFLHSDNQTLYFSSTGRGGSGKADIFCSRLKDEEWAEARNIGAIINTPRDDIYFTLPGSGELAYFSSNMRGGLGEEDIYSIEIPLLMPKKRFFLIQGFIRDKNTGKPIRARVEARNPETDKTLAMVNSSPKSGLYQILLSGKAEASPLKVHLIVTSGDYRVGKQEVDLEAAEDQLILTRDFALEFEKP